MDAKRKSKAGSEPENLKTHRDGEPGSKYSKTQQPMPITPTQEAAQASNESEEEFRILFENLPIGVGVVDFQGNLLAFNNAMLEAGGYSRQDIQKIGNVAALYYNQKDREHALRLFQSEGFLKDYPVRFKRKDGTPYDALLSLRSSRFQGQPCIHAVVEDVTERKQTEEKLRESENRFRTLADHAPVLIWMSGPDKLCNYFNKGWLDFTGRTMEQELGNGWAEGVHPDDFDRCLKTYISAFDARREFEMEYRLRRHDGQYRWIVDIGVPRFLPSDEFSGYIGSCIDVTMRKQVEEALYESESDLKTAQTIAKLGSWKIELDTGIASWSAEMFSLYGRDPAIGTPLYPDFLEYLHADDRQALIENETRAIAERRSFYNEYRVLDSSGGVRWFAARGEPQFNQAGKPFRIFGTTQDITGLRLAEAALRESEQRLSLFFNQSLDGFFFSMLDEPREWNDAIDKEAVLDYVMTHQRITEVNNAMFEQYGATREKFIGRTASDFFAHDLEQGRSLRRALFDQGHLHRETQERKEDGAPLWVEGDYVCIPDDQGRITGMFGIQRDITERKQAGAQSLHERSVLELIASNASLPEILMSLVLGHEKLFPGTMCSVLLLDASGKHLVHGAAPSLPVEYVEAINGVAIGPNVGSCGTAAFTGETVIVADIEIDPRWADFRSVALPHNLRACWSMPFQSAQGAVLGTFAMYYRAPRTPEPRELVAIASSARLTGIAIERKLAEEALQKAEEKYRLLLERLPAVVYTSELGVDGIWHYVSPHLEGLLGFSTEEWLADPGLWRRQIHPDDLERQEALEEQAYTQGKPFEGEYRLLRQDGREIWVRDSGHFLPQKNGDAPIVQGILTDITEHKQAEEKINQQNEYLELLNNMTRAILLSKDFELTMQTLAVDMAKLMDADDCYITRWDPLKEKTVPVASTAKLARPYRNMQFLSTEQTMTQSVLHAGRTLAANDVYLTRLQVALFGTSGSARSVKRSVQLCKRLASLPSNQR